MSRVRICNVQNFSTCVNESIFGPFSTRQCHLDSTFRGGGEMGGTWLGWELGGGGEAEMDKSDGRWVKQ